MLLAWLVVTVALRLRALGQGGWAVGVVVGIGGLAIKGGGFFSPLAGMTVVSFAALLVWILVTAVVFWRLIAAADEAAPA